MHSYRRLEAWKQAMRRSDSLFARLMRPIMGSPVRSAEGVCELHLDRLPKQSVWLWRPEKPIT